MKRPQERFEDSIGERLTVWGALHSLKLLLLLPGDWVQGESAKKAESTAQEMGEECASDHGEKATNLPTNV